MGPTSHDSHQPFIICEQTEKDLTNKMVKSTCIIIEFIDN